MAGDETTLADIAHGRSGDKGNHANVAVLAYTPAGFAWLKEHLTVEAVRRYFEPLGPSRVARYEAPNLLALNFMLYDILAGGASRSLRTDTQGKTLALALLRMQSPRPENLGASVAPRRGGDGMSGELVLYEVQTPAAILTLNRPERRNALSRSLIAALGDAFARAADDRAVRCVITDRRRLGLFCAGMDLAELQESLGASSEKSPVWQDALRLATLYDTISSLAETDDSGGERGGGGGRCGTGLRVRPGRRRTGSEVRLPRGAPRPSGGDGHAALAAPRRRTNGSLPAAIRRHDWGGGSAASGIHQRRDAGGAPDGYRFALGKIAGGGRPQCPGPHQGAAAQFFTAGRVSGGGGASQRARA